MKKYFYTVCCFLAATTFALTSCGDDETIIDEPDVPVTPDPDEEQPEKLSYCLFQVNKEASLNPCVGDSLALYELIDPAIQHLKDSLEAAESKLALIVDGHSFMIQATTSNDEQANSELKALRKNLVSVINAIGKEPRGFVYTGNIWDEYAIYGTPVISGSDNIAIFIPDMRNTAWSTTQEDAPVQSISFGKSSTTYINGDQETAYKLDHVGETVTLAALDNTTSYVFQLNETGTELTLVSINGEEVSETYVYTKETPAE